MKLLAYGEDALTLWAINNKLQFILNDLCDNSSLSDCSVIFRPSFGRSGGRASSQFGEFDFIILSKSCLYLGESKWDKSSERIYDSLLQLRPEQLLRHRIFTFYVQEWAFGTYKNWQDFAQRANCWLPEQGITKPIAPANSLLARNLITILSIIKKHYSSKMPQIRNVILYFYKNKTPNSIPKRAKDNFEIICIDYSKILIDELIDLELKVE